MGNKSVNMVRISKFHSLLGFLGFSVILFTGWSCGRSHQEGENSEAFQLFSAIRELNMKYIDSLVVAKDSNQVNKLTQTYEERMVKINFSYSPDTDLLMTEGQNDTIVALTSRFALIRDSLLYRFSNPILAQPADSTVVAAPDSLPAR